MWGSFFFLLAFFHLPIMDEKLVHPPQLLHGLCPFVLSHKGSSLTFVFYSLHAYTSLQTSHIADFMHKDISYPYVFLFFCFFVKKVCQSNCYSQVRWHYSVFDGCTSKLLFFFFLLFWSALSRSRNLIYWMLKRFFCRWRHRKGYWLKWQENMPFASKCLPANVILPLPCWDGL